MTKWQTDPQLGLRVGVMLIAAVLLVDGGLITWAATHAVNIWTFVAVLLVLASVLAVGIIVYSLNGLIHSDYTLDRNTFTITWGPNEQVIPTPDIERVVAGKDVTGRVRFRGIRWPGLWAGYGKVDGIGPTLFYASAPIDQQAFLVTSGLTYAVSPEDLEGFLLTLQTRMQMGPTQLVEPESFGPEFLQWDFWQDWLGMSLLIGASIAVAVLFGYLCAQFPALPRLLPLHFDAAGEPDRLGPQGQIFFLPLIGLIVLLANSALGMLLYRRERMAAYLLWGGAAAVQVFIWAAVLGILVT
ncbi:MAG: DUF1648 domain-containing protein [Anaerolineae bacterium]|nr:DUF1648 domain-containing protein [Anaerolineae bacterium]